METRRIWSRAQSGHGEKEKWRRNRQGNPKAPHAVRDRRDESREQSVVRVHRDHRQPALHLGLVITPDAAIESAGMAEQKFHKWDQIPIAERFLAEEFGHSPAPGPRHSERIVHGHKQSKRIWP